MVTDIPIYRAVRLTDRYLFIVFCVVLFKIIRFKVTTWVKYDLFRCGFAGNVSYFWPYYNYSLMDVIMSDFSVSNNLIKVCFSLFFRFRLSV